jgi:hypothetical protein
VPTNSAQNALASPAVRRRLEREASAAVLRSWDSSRQYRVVPCPTCRVLVMCPASWPEVDIVCHGPTHHEMGTPDAS